MSGEHQRFQKALYLAAALQYNCLLQCKCHRVLDTKCMRERIMLLLELVWTIGWPPTYSEEVEC